MRPQTGWIFEGRFGVVLGKFGLVWFEALFAKPETKPWFFSDFQKPKLKPHQTV